MLQDVTVLISQYSVACVRRSKKPESITDAKSKTSIILGGFWQIMVFNFRTINTNRCVNSSTLKCQKLQLKVCGLMDFVKDIMV